MEIAEIYSHSIFRKKLRETNVIICSTQHMMISRNICQGRVNFSFFHTVYTTNTAWVDIFGLMAKVKFFSFFLQFLKDATEWSEISFSWLNMTPWHFSGGKSKISIMMKRVIGSIAELHLIDQTSWRDILKGHHWDRP